MAEARPDLALNLVWRFMALADPVLNRVDDSSGSVREVFQLACTDLSSLAARTSPDPAQLAEREVAAVTTNSNGEFDGLIRAVFPALGSSGATALSAALAAALPRCPTTDRYDSRAAATRALQDLADGEGNGNASIALVPTEARPWPRVAAQIGR